MQGRFAKILVPVVIIAIMAIAFFGFNFFSNRQVFDTTYSFNYAYVQWPDGTAEKLKIKSWKDYEGEQIQIKTEDGKTYVFHSSNCVLASE
jgi:hypothetical protein